MTFSQQVKQEMVEHPLQRPCCVEAACYGVALFGKYFDTRGVVLHTDSQFIAAWALATFEKAGIKGQMGPRSKTSASWEFAVKDPFEEEKMLAMFSHSGDEPSLRIRTENLECEGCFAAFCSAAFLCCGVVINPQKGYMLEFVTPRHRLAKDFAALLSQHGFGPKTTLRGGHSVLYFKASEQIEDMLTTMGATKSALEIMNLKVYKDLRNRANRVTNCETANIDKIVAANSQTLNAITILERHGALDSLPEPLREAARLRRAHPDLSLAELAEKSKQPVSKSGLSHRYRKIQQLAAELEKRAKAQPPPTE